MARSRRARRPDPERQPDDGDDLGEERRTLGLLTHGRRRGAVPMMVPRRSSRPRRSDAECRCAPTGSTGPEHKATQAHVPVEPRNSTGASDDELGRPARARRTATSCGGSAGARYGSTTTARTSTWSPSQRTAPSYWVVNSLLDRPQNETMIAIAKGLRPLAKVRKSA